MPPITGRCWWTGAGLSGLSPEKAMDETRGSATWWDARYLDGDIPWDTGVVPPEVVSLVDSGLLKPGWAFDLGCGSGLCSRYLAGHGFRAVGVDLARVALSRGRRAAQAADLPAYYCLADVGDLSFLVVTATLALDVGCFHSIPSNRRASYIASLANHLAPGAYYLLYAFEPAPGPPDAGEELPAVGPAAIGLFSPLFTLRWAQHGSDRQRLSSWYLLQRA